MHHRKQKQRGRAPTTTSASDFAHPQEPIRVILARDEELGLHENSNEDMSNESITPPPPAYGLWRFSVVCILDIVRSDILLTRT